MREIPKPTRRDYLKASGAAGALGLSGLSGCISNITGGGGPIPMGSILPITGALEAYGSGMQASVALAVEDVNGAGGPLGRTIELTKKDSETKPEKAKTKYDSLVSEQGIIGFVGAASSGVSTTLAKNVAADQVMEVSNASTSPALASSGYSDGKDVKYFGRTSPNDGQQGLIMGVVLNDRIQADTAAFLHISNAYGKGLAEKAKEAFDGESLRTVGYSKDTTDYTSTLDKLHDGNPDAIGFVGYPANGETILKQWSEGGYGTSSEDWVLSEGLNSTDFLTSNKDIVANMYVSSPDPRDTDGAKKFQNKIGEQNTLFAPHAYDAMFLQALAIERAGEATGTAIAKNIRAVSRPEGTKVTVGEFQKAKDALGNDNAINYQGASSPVDMNENLEPINPFAILRVKDDGSTETLDTFSVDYFEGKL